MGEVGEKHTVVKTKKPSAKSRELVLFTLFSDYTARVTFPERRQRVQAYTRLGEPSTIALTRRMLGFQLRLDRL